MPACKLPSLTTLPVAPLRVRVMLPAMKSALLMPLLLAVRLPTSIDALLPNSTPLGLIRKIWPLPVILPKIWLGFALSTSLSVAAALPGCTKFTWAALPRLKVFQSMTARCEV